VGNFYQARRQAAMAAKVPKVEPKPKPVHIMDAQKFTEDDDGMLWA
jgi:hypothetical protein